MEDQKKIFMAEAIRLSIESVENGGGPFGAVIVKNGEMIAASSNSVSQSNDPTAHAEINAIRMAAKKINNFNLSGCEIYTSCEPCPMCLGAIYWSHINKVYYGNSKEDAKNIGFDDSFIYDELDLKPAERNIPAIQIQKEEAIKAFEKWQEKEDKIEY